MIEFIYYFLFFFLYFNFFNKNIHNFFTKSFFQITKLVNQIFKLLRNDIIDRNGNLVARNIKVYHAAIKPKLIKDKKKFILKLKLLYPEIDTSILRKILKKKIFLF